MTIYLIDGHAFCYRAFFGLPGLRNSKGELTNVVYGFAMLIRKILADFKPDGLAVTFDMRAPTFRHEKFADYKAHRKPMPEEMIEQMPRVRELVKAYRIPIFEKAGFEADDVLGTLAKRLSAKGHEVRVVTADKDAFQLVNKDVKILNPSKDYLVIDAKGVEKIFGVKPEQVVDTLSLMGDSSDNVPGVRGIGPKTALSLVQEFGSLEKLYRSLDRVKPEGKRKLLEDHKEDAFMSKELVTIDCDVPLEAKPEDFKVIGPEPKAIVDFFKEMEFRQFLKDYADTPEPPPADRSYRRVATASEWKKVLNTLKEAPRIALDFETTSTDALAAEPVGISFAVKPHEAVFVLFDAHQSGLSELSARKVLEDMKPLFESARPLKIGQNLKYEMTILRRYGIELKGIGMDTMIGSYLLNPAKPNHNLSDLAMEHLGETLIEIESLIGTGKQQITMASADVDKLVAYGCQDSDVAFRLASVIEKKIEERGMSSLLKDIEIPLIEVLCEMESNGIAIDKALLKKFSKQMGESIEKLAKQIFKAAGSEFNINSPKQLGEILFVKLKLPVIRKTKTGPSTDADVLNELAHVHELPKLIVSYRELAKLKSTYVDAMPEMTHPSDGRIHSSFNQTVTATGRLSSNEPNLQNIPVRTEEGRQIRRAFVADKGYLLLSADYSQIELRVLAHLSGDEALRKAFKDGVDVHAYTASLIFGVKASEVTPEMRDSAKTVNFGILYGMSAFGLSRSLKISQDSARDFIQSYFDRYPQIKRYLDETLETARKRGFVETLFKRRRYIPDILSKDARLRQFSERTAINAPVQGTASDLIKAAMIRIHEKISGSRNLNRLVLQVHDELVFEVKESSLKSLARLVTTEMEQAAELAVPLEVDTKFGPNWLEMKAV